MNFSKLHFIRKYFRLACAPALAMGLLASPAQAQTFPDQPIRIVIGFPPGGGIDILARIIAPPLSESLGQPVIIDNRPGASGVLGMSAVAKAKPDGYTIFLGTTGNISVNSSVMDNLPFDVERDFDPLMQVAAVPFLIYAHPKLPVKNLAELVKLAKSQPGQINYYSSGKGGLPHLTGELFNSLAGVKTFHIPYKGSAPGMNALLGGEVELGVDAVANGLQHVKAGKLNALAVTGTERISVLPDVAPAQETVPDLVAVNWYGMLVPAGTPKDVVQRLNQEITKVLKMGEVRERLLAQGIDPVTSTPEAFGAFIKAETAKWGRVVREADIRAD